MNRRLLGVVVALAVAVLGFGGWVSLRDDETPSKAPTGTPGGALTFVLPPTWQTLACGTDEGDCVRVATPGMIEAHAATVSFLPPNPVEGTPVDTLINPDVTVPGSTRITVDGLPATRLDPDRAGQDAILVAGRARTEVGYAFMVLCPVGGDAERARGLCEQILSTLRVTR
ncbi:hypothetical protein LL946_00400 [Knoellia locipacati]|uniref:hypothetical protein n=1 Tax=Knoellia locipacati TaxID=882824 RepID=UPI003851292B